MNEDRLGLETRIGILLDRQKALYAVESRGLPFDTASALAEAGKLREAYEALVAGLPFRPTEPAARRYWFDPKPAGMGLVPYEVTGKGAPSLTAEVVSRMVKDNIPHAATWAKIAKIDTALSMWYVGYANAVGPDGRLRCVFRPTKVVSGRTSVERVNLQAIPRSQQANGLPEGTVPVRDLIRLPPGSSDELWDLDLAGAELRMAAKFARCDKMVSLIEAGADLHSATARELFQVDPSHPDWDVHRQAAKKSNLSLIFGTGGTTLQGMLAREVNIYWDLERCKRLVYAWNQLYDWKFKQAIYRASRQVENRHWLRLANGRIRRFSELEVRFESHKAFNQFIQGSLAECVLDWLTESEREHPGVIINMVHDSLVLQVPKGPVGQAAVTDIAACGKRIFEEMFGIVGKVDVKPW